MCARSGGYEIKIMQRRQVADEDEVEENVECTYKHMLKCIAAYQQRVYNEKVNLIHLLLRKTHCYLSKRNY